MTSRCTSSATRTLYGTTVIGGGQTDPIYSTRFITTTISGVDQLFTTTICPTGPVNSTGLAACVTSTSTLSGTPTPTTIESVYTIGPSNVNAVTSTFPTATEYATSCTVESVKQEETDPTTTTRTTTAAVTVTPKVEVTIGVSSAARTVTDAQGRFSVSVQVITVSNLFTSQVAVATGVTNLATKSSSTPIGPIVGGVVGGLALLGAFLAFLCLRKKRRSSARDDDDDDDDVYGVVRRESGRSGRGEKIEKRRMDLNEEADPGLVQPFTYSEPSPANAHHIFNASHAYGSVPLHSPGVASGPIDPFAAGPMGVYAPSSAQSHSSPPNSPPQSMTSAQAKALEAHRSRSPQSVTSGGYSMGDAGPSTSQHHAGQQGSMEDEADEVVVHQDAGPARVELPPMYADRA